VLVATGYGGGDVVVPYGTKYTITVNVGAISTCTFKVNENGGTYKPQGFTVYNSYWSSELNLNAVPVSVSITGTGQYASWCGTSGTWYLDTYSQVWPYLEIR